MNLYGQETVSTCSTIDDFIALRSTDTVTYYNLSILAKSLVNSNLIYSESNILDTYMDELKKIYVEIELTPEQYSKYKYKPKLLAYDLYGSTEIFFVIMALNGICNIKDFNLKKVRLVYASDMVEFINSVVSAEKRYIELNRKYIEEE